MTKRQAGNITAKEADFQRTWDATFHWRGIASMLLGSPALRAAWPMSSVDYQQPECTDISGHANHLQASAALGNVTFGRDPNGIAPIANFGGAANQYLLKADGGAGNWADILGTETYILAADRGLTLGGWFWGTTNGAIGMRLMAKDDGAANRQYLLEWTIAGFARFWVWPGPVNVQSANAVNSPSLWNHVIGIYDQANQDLHVILNGVTTSNLGAAPAALADTATPFTIGADGAGGNRFTGYASDCILSAASLSQGFVKAGYHYTKAAYGVK